MYGEVPISTKKFRDDCEEKLTKNEQHFQHPQQFPMCSLLFMPCFCVSAHIAMLIFPLPSLHILDDDHPPLIPLLLLESPHCCTIFTLNPSTFNGICYSPFIPFFLPVSTLSRSIFHSVLCFVCMIMRKNFQNLYFFWLLLTCDSFPTNCIQIVLATDDS